ncbi:type IV pilus modification protein PilV [Methylobacter sp. YRD-M1]|uniref:type IV pilus modification protein PilV n=1 Tax=Methylobacter sp. YRD-M1 TaxID=2911520 RepID=UPI00227D69FF|nr:type IV pilus modification protein PilV [Methylobacter sp. YRD-M1]WAK01248.1 type IV pilus modification protein PilV [Methylobacter sp. YRD-M1]
MKKPLHVSQGGFSLLEALISALILAVAMLGMARLQGITLISSADSRMKTHALNLAQDKIEELRSFANQNTYTGYSGSDNNTAVGANSTFTRTWTVTPCDNSVDCKQLNAKVTWTDPRGATQTVQLTSYIAEADPVKSGVALLLTGGGAGGGSGAGGGGGSGAGGGGGSGVGAGNGGGNGSGNGHGK